jgi:hypothetical protein
MSVTQFNWSHVALADPGTYYGGYKEPRLLVAETIKRALSDRAGQPESAAFSLLVSDHDRLLRGKLAGITSKWFQNKLIVARMIEDERRRQLEEPFTCAIGYITDYQAVNPFRFRFRCEDFLASIQGIDIPKRVVAVVDFPTAPDDKGVGGDATTGKTYTTPHPSITIPPCPGYVQLSNEAQALNMTGTVSNGTYGLCDARGWIMYDGSGNFIPEGWVGHAPPVTGDVSWASPDVAGVLEAAVGGASTLVTVGLPIPVIYGNITDQIGGEPGVGQAIGVYAGIEVLPDAQQYHVFIVCGHAVKAITGIYTENGTTGVGTNPASSVGDLASAAAAGAGGPWVVPGYGNWDAIFGGGAPTYRDINGRRYTIVYGKVGNRPADVAAGYYDPTDRAANPIAFNVQGVETVGDGTGTLITDGFQQYLHVLRNFIMGDYQGGNWPEDGPTWSTSPAIEILNDDSFTAAAAIRAAQFAGGYVGAFMMGANGVRESPYTWIRRFNESLGCFSGWSNQFQFFVRVIDASVPLYAASRRYQEQLDIFADTFGTVERPGEFANAVTYSHTMQYSENRWKTELVQIQDDESVSQTGQTKLGDQLELWMVRDATQAEDVARRRLMLTKEPPRYVKWDVAAESGVEAELGDLIRISHTEGIGQQGWIDHPLFITRHELDPQRLVVSLEALDIGRLFTGTFILGDEDLLPATWTDASLTQQQYGYLCDETTGAFSDGKPGKRLR